MSNQDIAANPLGELPLRLAKNRDTPVVTVPLPRVKASPTAPVGAGMATQMKEESGSPPSVSSPQLPPPPPRQPRLRGRRQPLPQSRAQATARDAFQVFAITAREADTNLSNSSPASSSSPPTAPSPVLEPSAPAAAEAAREGPHRKTDRAKKKAAAIDGDEGETNPNGPCDHCRKSKDRRKSCRTPKSRRLGIACNHCTRRKTKCEQSPSAQGPVHGGAPKKGDAMEVDSPSPPSRQDYDPDETENEYIEEAEEGAMYETMRDDAVSPK
ncbi:hypothetical protein PG994_009542 [Apiospora phragmitis]|uniref:Zn(2)-C6 fungal-type domain-containing protein n=1 Tax=Apiospora phragmitis TaxID=2905665 RepID=A0ABR1U6H3_9PEZI